MVAIGRRAIEPGEKVDKDTHLGRQKLAAGVNGIKPDILGGPVLGQENLQFAFTQLRTDVPGRSKCNADAGQQAFAHDLVGVGLDRRLRANGLDPVRTGEPPRVLVGCGNGHMVCDKILDAFRSAVLFEIDRACAQDAVDRCQAPGDETGIGELRNTDGKVIAVTDDVDKIVGKIEIDRKIGVFSQELAKVQERMIAMGGVRAIKSAM